MYVQECMDVYVYSWIKYKGKAYTPLHLFLAHGSGNLWPAVCMVVLSMALRQHLYMGRDDVWFEKYK